MPESYVDQAGFYDDYNNWGEEDDYDPSYAAPKKRKRKGKKLKAEEVSGFGEYDVKPKSKKELGAQVKKGGKP